MKMMIYVIQNPPTKGIDNETEMDIQAMTTGETLLCILLTLGAGFGVALLIANAFWGGDNKDENKG